MRVLHVLNSSRGGATIGALELMRTSRLAGSGIEHFAVYPGRASAEVAAVCTGAAPIRMRWWTKQTSWRSPMSWLVWLREMQLTGFERGTQRALEDLITRWKIDLVHTNNAAIIAGALAARRLGVPHVWHIRERIGEKGFMHFRLNDDRLVRRVSDLSRKIVAMSRFAGEIFAAHGQGAKLRVVYDGVDPAIYDAPAACARGQALRATWGVAPEAILIGKVAAVTSMIKRHELFIRAAAIVAARHPTARFAIIGALPQPQRLAKKTPLAYFANLRQLASRLGLDGRLFFTGDVADQGAAMNALDVLAHACDLEGFGRVAIEAMMAGKPVVGPTRGGIAESVVAGETGELFAPGDAEAMAAHLCKLVESEELRRAYGDAGRARAKTHFSPETHWHAMREIYTEVLQ